MGCGIRAAQNRIPSWRVDSVTKKTQEKTQDRTGEANEREENLMYGSMYGIWLQVKFKRTETNRRSKLCGDFARKSVISSSIG
jgi:hypothetical protein